MSEGPRLQSPGDLQDQTLDWSTWLNADTLASATWTIKPSTGTSLTDKAPTTTATSATVWVSGLTLGQVYELTCRVVTTAGRQDQDSITIRCTAL